MYARHRTNGNYGLNTHVAPWRHSHDGSVDADAYLNAREHCGPRDLDTDAHVDTATDVGHRIGANANAPCDGTL
jgi:hypothetical protein